MSDYEKKRLENIENNKRILRELGLEKPLAPIPPPVASTRNKKRSNAGDNSGAKATRSNAGSTQAPPASGAAPAVVLRRSSRLASMVHNKKII